MKYIQSKMINVKKIQDKWYLLEKNKQYIRELNEVASYIWSFIQTPKTFQSIVDKVTKEYDVDLRLAEKDVKKFLEEYVRAGFVHENPS